MMRVIGGIKGSRRLRSSKSKALRPTLDRVRESIFNILRERVTSAKVLDLFSGIGSVGIESLSRGASEVIFVEKDSKIAEILKENLHSLGFETGNRILKMDFTKAIKVLSKEEERFDIIYIDPPYASGFAEISLRLLAEYDILKEEGLALAEHFHKDKLDDRFGDLKLYRVKKIGDTCISFYKKTK